MRSSSLSVLLALALIPSPLHAQTFKLTTVVAREAAPVITVFVSTTGPAPSTITAKDAWKVSARQGDRSVLLESPNPSASDPFTEIRYNAETEQMEIDVVASRLAGFVVEKAGWQVGYFGPQSMSVATAAEIKPGLRFTRAKSKDDADIYVLGAFLAGRGTKPIWMLDAKGSGTVLRLPEQRDSDRRVQTGVERVVARAGTRHR